MKYSTRRKISEALRRRAESLRCPHCNRKAALVTRSEDVQMKWRDGSPVAGFSSRTFYDVCRYCEKTTTERTRK